MQSKLHLALLLFLLFLAKTGFALDISVNQGESIQGAIDAANDGDTITVSTGKFEENLDFKGKAIRLLGQGRRSIIDGGRNGPVVSFQNGETSSSILEGFRLKGGRAIQGAGILISDSSPSILRNYIVRNQATSSGSGIHVEGDSSPTIMGNLIFRNTKAPGGNDPHGVQIEGASPMLINNTIAFGDSNGILIEGQSNALILNNIIAFNGSGSRGRGICEFGGSSEIKYNLFFRNTVSAILSKRGRDFDKIVSAERSIAEARISDNLDANPRFRWQRRGQELRPRSNRFGLKRRSKARNRGNPLILDRDGSRSDIGFSGGE